MAIPDIPSYDWILINSSAGKDSQAMLDYVVNLPEVDRKRVVVVHCDLGRVEWKGTRELAAEQAEHYGLRFVVVSRDRDLLSQIEFERHKFPDSGNRFCTSDQKTGQVAKLLTALSDEVHAQGVSRPVRILNCLGLRAQESIGRAKKLPFEVEKKPTGKGTVKHVDRWLPIFTWTEDQVWERIRQSGVRYHWAYDKGMERLSCCFCVFAKRADLLIAAKYNPELAQEYADLEARIGFQFKGKPGSKDGISMAEIVAASKRAVSA